MPGSVTAVPNPTADAQKFRSHMGLISRHSATFFLGTVFTLALGYLFKIYLARTLGPETLGLYALGMTLVGFFGVFNGCGLPEAAVRFIAAYKASGEIAKLRSFLAIGTTVLLIANLVFVIVFRWGGAWVAVRFYHSQTLPQYLSLFAALLFLGALRTFLEKAMAGYKDVSRRTLIVNFVGTPTTILIAVLLISLGYGLRGYLCAQVISSAVILGLLAFAIWELTPRAERLPDTPVQHLDPEVYSFSVTILVMGMLGFFLSQADKITLGYYRGARQVGIYSVAAALVAYMPLVLQSVNQIFAPTIADLHARGDHELLARLFQTLTKWIIALTLPLALVMIVLARPLMRMFGTDFEVGWPILVIGAVGQLVNCGVGSVGYMLLMSGHQRRLMRVQAVMAVFIVIMNVALVPVWGTIGAAVADALTNVMINLWYLAEVRSRLQVSPYNRSYLKLVLPGLAASLALWLVCSRVALSLHIVVLLLIALAVTYATFLTAFVSFGLTGDDRLLLSTARRRIEAIFAR